MSARQHRGGAGAGNALGVGRWLLDRVQQGGAYLIVGRGVGGATPTQEKKQHQQEFRTACRVPTR